ncbi:heat shock factor protein 1-like, partial [Pipra filicauda]|uniref:Heat shock factor protein 1-like n=1 Tax=Pipra filicauda TaxID=649802 RepID=A0A7R5KBL1_9PASS
LIQFLISLVQSNRILGVKRKIPLMLNDSSSAHSMPKYSRQYSLEHVHGSSPYAASSPAYSGSNLYSPDSSANSGPIISDVTELAQSSPSASPSGSLDGRWDPAPKKKKNKTLESSCSRAAKPRQDVVIPLGIPWKTPGVGRRAASSGPVPSAGVFPEPRDCPSGAFWFGSCPLGEGVQEAAAFPKN